MARQAGVPVEEITEDEERLLSRPTVVSEEMRAFFSNRQGKGRSGLSEENYIERMSAAIEILAEQGNIVFVGRGVQMILAGRPGALHVHIYAPPEVRAPARAGATWLAGCCDCTTNCAASGRATAGMVSPVLHRGELEGPEILPSDDQHGSHRRGDGSGLDRRSGGLPPEVTAARGACKRCADPRFLPPLGRFRVDRQLRMGVRARSLAIARVGLTAYSSGCG